MPPATPSPDAPSPTRSPRDVLDGLLPGGAPVVVDVGCGDGPLVRHLAHRGTRAIGVEVGEEPEVPGEATARRASGERVPRSRFAADPPTRRRRSESDETRRPRRAVSRVMIPVVRELPLPPHFDPGRVGAVWRVRYEDRAREAEAWAEIHAVGVAVDDSFRVCLLAVDVQNTFCIPDFELFVAGRSGTGAVDDSRRLCEFVYRNLATITQIVPSLDTHHAMQVFHAIWLVDEHGRHPSPYTLVSLRDVEAERWRVNPAVVEALGLDRDYARRHLAHYTRRLAESGKYDLTVWPYHAMLGGIGHALVSAVEEAAFFHGIARHSQPDFQVKGDHPLTEHYSMLGPEVTEGPDGDRLAGKNDALIAKLLTFDAVVVAGQAKSHCLAWTIDDLLEHEEARERLATRTYLLADCTSPVVVPGVVDYTDEADAAFKRYAAAGMHVVRAADPIETWPGFRRSAG